MIKKNKTVDYFGLPTSLKYTSSFKDLLIDNEYSGYTLVDVEIDDDILNKDFTLWNQNISANDTKKFELTKFFKHNTMDFFIHITKMSIYPFIKFDDENVGKIVDYLNGIVKPRINLTPKLYVVVNSNNGYAKIACDVEPFDINVNTMYNDDFLPVYNVLIDKLNNTKKGIVLLHGKPVTGKTNLIKHLTIKVPNKNLIIIPSSFIPQISSPTFLEFLIANNNSILILEDCESYLKERSAGGSDCVSSLLNISDGIMTDVLNIQIICTFNTKLKNIDKAFLRKGRLILEYEFKELELNKAKSLVEGLDIKLPKILTLSEIFNSSDESIKTEAESGIGFV